MFLKNYQIKVINTLKQFYQTAKETKSAFETAAMNLPPDMRQSLNWVATSFQKLQINYKDSSVNGLKEYYPRIVMKLPTGGGKTLLAVEAIREYQNLFAQKRTGLVVWIVPSETIYSQTVQKLRDKGNHLRQLLDQCSGGKTLILEKGQRLSIQDIEENLVVLFIMIQSISRTNGKEALKVFQDSGGYESFFPLDNRYDLHKRLLEEYPNLDYVSALTDEFPLIMTSLGNAIRVSRPFIIIDEIHKVFSETARKTIDNLNPSMVMGLSATPKNEMNILITISGLELKDEEMIKLDMHILPPISQGENDWKAMLKEIKEHREMLEKKAIEFRKDKGIYIRPMALLQVEATGKDQRGRGRVHSLDVKEYLTSLEINPDEIAIKTSSQNDIEDINLFSSDCPVRYIITKEALREGWDCSFAYVLGVIPNVNSDTGITQLVGRILRQPNAKKTGIKELDESYVFYSKGDSRQMLEKVVLGFRNEGLEDLFSNVKLRDNANVNATKTTKIKPEFKEKFYNDLYLPVWIMIESNGQKRRFSYHIDIKPVINLLDFSLSDQLLKAIESSLSAETKERKSFAVTISTENKAVFAEENQVLFVDGQINMDYITRRYNEIIENPFQARKLAENHLKQIKERIGVERLADHFSFIVSSLCKAVHSEKNRLEEEIFLSFIEQKQLLLAVSNDSSVGFRIPESDTIAVGNVPSTYRYYLFDDVEITAMNSLEKKVGDILDRQAKILWWFRNKVNKQWYSIQGWKEHKIRPDFVAAKKKSEDELELVYVIESKGEHLLGNEDTQYKNKVLTLMTEQNKSNNIEILQQVGLPFSNINDKAEFYLIEEGKEEETIRKLFNN